jgi:uncharacterized protein YndB with AHSA1/START domain
MPSATGSITIQRPIAEVFAFFADAENDPQWRPGVVEIKRQGELGVGARYHQRVRGPAGRSIAADIEVTAYEPDRHLAFQGTAGPVRPHGDYTFRDTGDATEVTFTLEAQLSGLKKLIMGTPVQKTMDGEVACLGRARRALESRP